jgi:hypothetical protein
MPDIVFACPECSAHLVVDEKGVGLVVPCPNCGKGVRIPDVPASPVPPAAEAESPPSPALAHPDHGSLHLQKNPDESWREHRSDETEQNLLHKLGFDTENEPAVDPIAASHHEGEQGGVDLNLTLAWGKKKDHWFTTDGKKYHYCYYNPHSPEMITACATEKIPVSADIAPDDLSGIRRGAYCKKCVKALEQERK